MLCPFMCRPSSRWDLGTDIIHEHEVFEEEETTPSKQMLDNNRNNIKSNDRLNYLCELDCHTA